MGAVTVGVDIGQKSAPTAVCVAEGQDGDVHVVRHLERLPLGTLYPHVAERLVNLRDRIVKVASQTPCFFVDATGVGQPVVDMLRERGLSVIAVYLTDSAKATYGTGELYLPKSLLVSRLQVLLQDGRLKLPRTPEAEALARELLDFEIRVSEDGHDSYGAFEVGTHDDLVIALGLAVWERAPSSYPMLVGCPRKSVWRQFDMTHTRPW